MTKHNGGCPYSGSCRCRCKACIQARRRFDHCGSHNSDCHLECAR